MKLLLLFLLLAQHFDSQVRARFSSSGGTGPVPLRLSTQDPKLKVGVYADGGALRKSVDSTKKALEKVGFEVAEFLAKDDSDKFDVLVFPGGSGSGEAKSLGKEGKDKVVSHLGKGKGVIGICAGAYMMLKDGGLPLVDGVLVDGEHWARGTGKVQLKVEKSKVFPKAATYTIHYENGPLIQPAGDPKLPDYVPLASFASDMAQGNAPKGKMPGTHAVVGAESGKGRIVLFSPHPEESGLESLLADAVRWSAKK